MSDRLRIRAAGPAIANPLLAALLRRMLGRLRHGRLVCRLPGGVCLEQQGPLPGPDAVLDVHQPRRTLTLLMHGAAGLHEGYIAGVWSLALIHISEHTRLRRNSYAVFCMTKKITIPLV